jgi:hypothetical protein
MEGSSTEEGAAAPGWRLGQTSQKYESGSRGAGTISTGKGDHGGASYGAYQLSSRTGTLAEYLSVSRYAAEFNGLRTATPEFDAKWRDLAVREPGFADEQHDFIRRTHYDIQLNRLAERGLDLQNRGPAVQDALWSTSVQFRNRARAIFEGGLEEKFGPRYRLSDLSDSDIVSAVQDYKVAHNSTLFASSPKLWKGLISRAQSEKAALLELCGNTHVLIHPNSHGPVDASIQVEQRVGIHRGETGEQVRKLQQLLSSCGYRDNHGRQLRADGDFGQRTEEALKSFQIAHGLPPVGHVGPRTHAALEAARLHGPSPVDPAHPDHALHQQLSRAVDAMEHSLGRTPDENSERLKASLLLAARQQGLTRVDHVVLSEARGVLPAGQHVFAVQGRLDDPASRRAHVATQQALATPTQESWGKLAQVEARRHVQLPAALAHAFAARHGEHGDGMRRSPSP